MLLLLLGAVVLAVAVVFACAVAVAVTDTFRIRLYKVPYDVLVVAHLDPLHSVPSQEKGSNGRTGRQPSLLFPLRDIKR